MDSCFRRNDPSSGSEGWTEGKGEKCETGLRPACTFIGASGKRRFGA
ncbi:hypothetical protein ACFLSQ_01835 [Bacteroidota bacterium]